jgi:hypothetical protein
MGMNSPGEIKPKEGELRRERASKPTTSWEAAATLGW